MERAIIIAVFASTGLWSFVSMIVQRYMERKSDYAMMMRGLGHDRICYLGECYIKRGCITKTLLIISMTHTKNLVAMAPPKKSSTR